MKVLLINPRDRDDINTRLPESVNRSKGIFAPLGLAYIASYLRENGNKEVKILDSEALNLTNDEIETVIKKVKPDIVGIASMTTILPHSLKVAKFAKNAGAITVLGGPHVSGFPEESVFFDFVDYAIIGEGEEAFSKLVKELEKKFQDKKYSLEKIEGLVYRKDGKVIKNSVAVIKDINELPFPAFDLLPMNKYFSVINERPFVTMMTSRGCPFRCGFCYKQPTDKYFRRRTPENVVDEIEHWIKIYNIKEVMFYDDTLTLNKEHINGICDEIIRRKLKIIWEGPTRVDCVDEALLRKMKKAGCRRLRYGVESGDKRILKLMRKGTNLELVKKVFDMSKKVGLENFAYFIVGYYSETPETMQKTIDFAIKLDPDWVMFTVATPYPNTDLFNLSAEAGLIDKEYWKKFSIGQRVGRMPFLVKDAEKWIKRAYFKFYFRPKFILNKIKKLDSLYSLKNQFNGAMSILGM